MSLTNTNDGFTMPVVPMGGGYSREGDTMSRLQSMMDEAQTEREREAIRRAMDSM